MTGRPEQIPLDFGHASATGRHDLLVSDRLKAAIGLVDDWPRWRSPVIVLAGPEGSGKSHLAAIWRARSHAVDIHPVEGSDAAAIAARGPVLFEDADRRGFDDETLFHVINSVRENATSLLITARAVPSAWGVTLADLASRLKAATVAEIMAPDEETLSGVLVKLFADRQLIIDDRLVGYIVTRMERSFAAASRLVDRLDRLALSRRTPISRALAAEVLDQAGVSSETD